MYLKARAYLKVKSGVIISSEISISTDQDVTHSEADILGKLIKDKTIQEIDDFETTLGQVSHRGSSEVTAVSRWLNTMLGKRH